MKTFAVKSSSKNDLARSPGWMKPPPIMEKKNLTPFPGGNPFIQPKLKIGQPNDKYEQEADRVADRIISIPEPKGSLGTGGSKSPLIQRQTDKSPEFNDKEEQVQRQVDSEEEEPEKEEEEEEEEEPVQAKHVSNKSPPISPGLQSKIHSLKGGGQPLPKSVSHYFEPRFGRDFSNVRVHTDAKAADAAKSINAKAFTTGKDVVFDTGQYSPGTRGGKYLMAHELTHVWQQGYAKSKSDSHQPTQAADSIIMPYRNKGAVNYGAQDTSTLKEKPFDSKAPDPYIENIKINFTTIRTIDSESVPAGTLSATYASNGAANIPSNIAGVAIVGGYPSQGLTDKTTNKPIHRIEGYGYHHKGVPKGERVGSKWPKYKYYKVSKGASASMSYALFFKGHQAIHWGSLSSGSLACVHVAAFNTMRKLNYHSLINKTKVTVDYSNAALKKPCCERYKLKGYMVSNPCGGQDKRKC